MIQKQLKYLVDLYPNQKTLLDDLNMSGRTVLEILNGARRQLHKETINKIKNLYDYVIDNNIKTCDIDIEYILVPTDEEMREIASRTTRKARQINNKNKRELEIGDTYIITDYSGYSPVVIHKGKVVKEHKNFYLIDNGKYKETIEKQELYRDSITIEKECIGWESWHQYKRLRK